MPEVGGRVDWHAEDHEQADAGPHPNKAHPAISLLIPGWLAVLPPGVRREPDLP
jgi:hypothetical protein